MGAAGGGAAAGSDFSSTGSRHNDGFTPIVYNNTLYNVEIGIELNSNANSVLRNNIVQGATTQGYSGTFGTSSNNLSNDASSPNDIYDSKTVTFMDVANDDYRLASTDVEAKDNGANPSADADIDNCRDHHEQSRPWIG